MKTHIDLALREKNDNSPVGPVTSPAIPRPRGLLRAPAWSSDGRLIA